MSPCTRRFQKGISAVIALSRIEVPEITKFSILLISKTITTEIPFWKRRLQGDMQLIRDLKCDRSWNLSLTFQVLVTIPEHNFRFKCIFS